MTGIFSLDMALGGGLPLRIITEIYGKSNTNKSTLGYYLAGRVSTVWGGEIHIADFEGLNKKYLGSTLRQAGAKGIKVTLIPQTEKLKDDSVVPLASERRLEELHTRFTSGGSCAAIIDPVSAIPVTAEVEGNIGDANMGRRAHVVAQFIRTVLPWVTAKSPPANVFLINHSFDNMGGMTQGQHTAGGDTVRNGSALRLRLRVVEREEDDSRVVLGTVDKFRFREGGEPQTFKFVTIPNFGIHVGLSAVQDCIDFGLTSGDRTITLDGKSYGYRKTLRENYLDQDRFIPFIKALDALRVGSQENSQ